jgi:hypothetical protein
MDSFFLVLFLYSSYYYMLRFGAGVAQSIQFVTTGCTTGVRSPAETKDFFASICVQTSSDAYPASYPKGTVCKAQQRRDAEQSPNLAGDIAPFPLGACMANSGTALVFYATLC